MGARFLQGMLFGVQPSDEVTLVSVTAGMIGVAAIASLTSAWRITNLDPARTLRHE